MSHSRPSGANLTISVYTVTSKSVALAWSKYTGASSYRLTATLRTSPTQSIFSTFGQNTIMGSIAYLMPSSAYTFKVEALDSFMNVLAWASIDRITGMYNANKQIYLGFFLF